MITKKEQIIKYFKSGIKNKKEFRIGIEHEKFLFNSANNKIIMSAHPSPYSANYGFFGSRPFSKANDFLVNTNQTKINW